MCEKPQTDGEQFVEFMLVQRGYCAGDEIPREVREDCWRLFARGIHPTIADTIQTIVWDGGSLS